MLTIESNLVFKENEDVQKFGWNGILVTPPLGSKGYWLYKIKLAGNQALVAFPKFGLSGIGFQKEKDWNTNLPHTCDAVEIYDHIKHNKGCGSKRGTCIKAIKLLQERIQKERDGSYLIASLREAEKRVLLEKL